MYLMTNTNNESTLPATKSRGIVASRDAARAERDQALAELAAERAKVDALIAYLLTDKFRDDPTVQVRDVMHRLERF